MVSLFKHNNLSRTCESYGIGRVENQTPIFLVRHVETSGALELCQEAELADAHSLLVESWGGRELEKGRPIRPSFGGDYMGSDGESRRGGPSYSRPVVFC